MFSNAYTTYMHINIGEQAKKYIDRRIVNRYLDPRKNNKKDVSVRQDFRIKWKQIMMEMIRFAPEFVIISAGFDAHDDDPLAWCDLLEEDFEWATDEVLTACVYVYYQYDNYNIIILVNI